MKLFHHCAEKIVDNIVSILKYIYFAITYIIKSIYFYLVYARVNASLNSRTIRLSFKLADRTLNTALTQAVWRIRVTQLECYNTLGYINNFWFLLIIHIHYWHIILYSHRIFRDSSIFDRSLDKNGENREARSTTAARDQYLIGTNFFFWTFFVWYLIFCRY